MGRRGLHRADLGVPGFRAVPAAEETAEPRRSTPRQGAPESQRLPSALGPMGGRPRPQRGCQRRARGPTRPPRGGSSGGRRGDNPRRVGRRGLVPRRALALHFRGCLHMPPHSGGGAKSASSGGAVRATAGAGAGGGGQPLGTGRTATGRGRSGGSGTSSSRGCPTAATEKHLGRLRPVRP